VKKDIEECKRQEKHYTRKLEKYTKKKQAGYRSIQGTLQGAEGEARGGAQGAEGGVAAHPGVGSSSGATHTARSADEVSHWGSPGRRTRRGSRGRRRGCWDGDLISNTTGRTRQWLRMEGYWADDQRQRWGGLGRLERVCVGEWVGSEGFQVANQSAGDTPSGPSSGCR
jgi:hypothetical protein